ncbi:hypothetical protein LSTR_LSTR003577 [Laodelphax striatellus]|uniref:Telomeric repeat-binding factor 2-interacting protein 1 n=1 Tax=Laodelphax striatellus TaxID=195883 RepID=A0A482WKV3_LAOST|nr:hypothetical protein LSTR_LSTR003577 [Laodelphax striatellus]
MSSTNANDEEVQPVGAGEKLLSDDEYIDSNEEQRASSSSSSDCEENVSCHSNSNFNLRNVSPFLFRNGNLEPLTFVLMLHDYSLESKAKDMILKGGGIVYSSNKEMDLYSIVLVKDDSLFRAHAGPVFKFQYLIKCIVKNKIVNINRYLKTYNNAPPLYKFDFMKVVYFKSTSWNEVPDHIMMNKKLVVNKGKENVKGSVVGECSKLIDTVDDVTVIDSSDESIEVLESPTPVNRTDKVIIKVNKHTRMPYSNDEDAKIVKYIVCKKAYDSVKGTIIWKNMERGNICPHRTWQSMKEHFLKKVLYQINYFNFLSDDQKRQFRKLL